MYGYILIFTNTPLKITLNQLKNSSWSQWHTHTHLKLNQQIEQTTTARVICPERPLSCHDGMFVGRFSQAFGAQLESTLFVIIQMDQINISVQQMQQIWLQGWPGFVITGRLTANHQYRSDFAYLTAMSHKRPAAAEEALAPVSPTAPVKRVRGKTSPALQQPVRCAKTTPASATSKDWFGIRDQGSGWVSIIIISIVAHLKTNRLVG